ncbi:hypothetical protein DSO57_1038162 [Entomophthora muscae]|uniref:Uncharacterized protein n=1 Tax=Entomophthora muscae TaxID=34485 RepID=A0ACC2TXC5_9FUNG|nr:hypothetical protein DSO57_1038162 [Entomophthora muscae]
MIFALLAGVLLGSALAACPPSDKCYHGGLLEHPETNAAKFPRCWFKEAGGHWGCYDPLNDSCSDINGRKMIDINSCEQPSQPSTSTTCPALNKCFHGGLLKYPETNAAKFPRCWVQEPAGHWGCYDPIDNSCNINGRNMVDINSCRQPAQPSTSTGCPALNKCFHGGLLKYPETNAANFPRCWVQEPAGHWGCYNPIDNSCNNINGRKMVDIASCSGPAPPTQPPQSSFQEACSVSLCYRGGQKSHPETNRANFPGCLWKEADGTWGCYDPLNNICSNINGRTMIDIRSCTGQSPKCPDLSKDSCQFNFDSSNIKSTEQPQFWVYSNNVWGCSDDANAIAGRGQVINLMDPPAECRRNDESLYICE